MDISKERLFVTALNLGIPKERVEALWASLETEDQKPKISSFSKWMFYFGAMIILSAMTWLMNLGWDWFGGGGIFLIAVAYAVLFTWLGAILWKREELKIAGGSPHHTSRVHDPSSYLWTRNLSENLA